MGDGPGLSCLLDFSSAPAGLAHPLPDWSRPNQGTQLDANSGASRASSASVPGVALASADESIGGRGADTSLAQPRPARCPRRHRDTDSAQVRACLAASRYAMCRPADTDSCHISHVRSVGSADKAEPGGAAPGGGSSSSPKWRPATVPRRLTSISGPRGGAGRVRCPPGDSRRAF